MTREGSFLCPRARSRRACRALRAVAFVAASVLVGGVLSADGRKIHHSKRAQARQAETDDGGNVALPLGQTLMFVAGGGSATDDGAMCLDIAGASRDPFAQVQLYRCIEGNPAQEWRVEALTDQPGGPVRIVSCMSDLCLDAASAGYPMPTSNLQVTICRDGPAQTFVRRSDGTIEVAPSSGLCVDVAGGAANFNDGTNVHVYYCNDTPAQQFSTVLSAQDGADDAVPGGVTTADATVDDPAQAPKPAEEGDL